MITFHIKITPWLACWCPSSFTEYGTPDNKEQHTELLSQLHVAKNISDYRHHLFMEALYK
jgi:hypothetical protein